MKRFSRKINNTLFDVASGPTILVLSGVGIVIIALVITILVVSIVFISKAIKKNHEKAKYSNSKNDGIEK